MNVKAYIEQHNVRRGERAKPYAFLEGSGGEYRGEG